MGKLRGIVVRGLRSLYMGLCFRCEHRAVFHESNIAPRVECGSKIAVHSCYMYRPVVPLVLAPQDRKDKRPFLGPAMIASRTVSIGVSQGSYRYVLQGDGIVVYWKPKGRKKKK